jgi:hypothetical protein
MPSLFQVKKSGGGSFRRTNTLTHTHTQTEDTTHGHKNIKSFLGRAICTTHDCYSDSPLTTLLGSLDRLY